MNIKETEVTALSISLKFFYCGENLVCIGTRDRDGNIDITQMDGMPLSISGDTPDFMKVDKIRPVTPDNRRIMKLIFGFFQRPSQ